MWTWFGIAVLARVLLASHEVDHYSSPNSGSDKISEGGSEGELPVEEFSKETTIKPETKTRLLKWQNDNIYQEINPYENSISNLIRELGPSASKIFPNTNSPKDFENERDKRSSTKQFEPSTPGSWIPWATPENRGLPFRNFQDSWQEIKKSREFSPWGGKRVTNYGQGPKVRRPIRVPFNSWGGKRSFSAEEKRTRFSSWGGKRDLYFGGEENPFENAAEKRTKFNAWGGKRSKNGERDDEEIKRNRFNAWGGKRNYKNAKRTPEDVDAKKNVFNAWGGKRFFGDNEVNPGEENLSKYGSWNEKEEEEEEGDVYNVDEKPRENNKIEAENMNNLEDNGNGNEEENEEVPLENGIIELPEKKETRNDYKHKSLFNPWGGRKRAGNDLQEIATGLDIILPESHHHHTRFWPWGG